MWKKVSNHSTWIFHCYKVSVDHCKEGSEKIKVILQMKLWFSSSTFHFPFLGGWGLDHKYEKSNICFFYLHWPTICIQIPSAATSYFKQVTKDPFRASGSNVEKAATCYFKAPPWYSQRSLVLQLLYLRETREWIHTGALWPRNFSPLERHQEHPLRSEQCVAAACHIAPCSWYTSPNKT